MEIEEKNASGWFCVEKVPENYIFSEEYRPEDPFIPVCDSIPIVDIGKAATNPEERIHAVRHILKASEEFGFFQVINHGIPEDTIVDTATVFREFFDVAGGTSEGSIPNSKGMFFGSGNLRSKGGVCEWRDNIKHRCHPLEDCLPYWSEKPSRYKEVVAVYVKEIQKLSARILEMICEGLGLETSYFEKMSEVQVLSANKYPVCPDPTLTLGLFVHHDPSLVTILYQGEVGGLQVLKDGLWIGVPALPNALLVNIGNQLEIISNGRLISPVHRVVTSSSQVRTSIATFVNPSPNCIIEPAKALVNETNTARFKSSRYGEYISSTNAFGLNTKGLQSWSTSA